ncbi:phosphate/phosphite/phosphonate ABC transporter substrate-binding protein [Stenotrophomonas rhizophila]|uniref:phosphate/phosphite/phosphonate ABC transporter substrate-binding protein n=1 Tax=Stenotrophomonas rhizophila TaxID=216778 RepID=UPI001E3A378E|nr:phosphate/phosphite/phosphonate ABC transporter substrate-binding protein [Stenotrophomonas rhizophila]MCC7632968.1 phosphate/phosphite/phosphonate ABC transporter substrate-binding protein [Stenotrophomonas rhizophila]MCC7662307.1 phosphate/phosphite/phosphonate ABC transporter substrate-binding protein [Stenotrophomonas rhizophila]
MPGLRWLLQASLLYLVIALVSGPVAAGPHNVLVLGRISDNPKAHYAQLQPLLDYVVPRMGEVGITEGRILMAPDAPQMASYLRRGRVDWVTETSGTAVALGLRSGAQPLLLTERSGVRDYHTVFFVRRDSAIAGLADLRGRTLALQNAASTSAYLVPVMTLLQQGLTPEILLSARDTAAPDTVGYVFARSEGNIATLVHKGVVDAGAVSSVDWSDGRRVPASFLRDFRVIHRTEPYPRAVEMVRAGLDPRVRDRLQQVLLQAASDPQAGPALKQFFGTSGFHRVDAQMQHRLDELKQGLARVRMEVE